MGMNRTMGGGFGSTMRTAASTNKPPTAYSPYHPQAQAQANADSMGAVSPNRDFLIKKKKSQRGSNSALAEQRLGSQASNRPPINLN